jgi:hypothetical protein
MPEEALETQELKDKLEEAGEAGEEREGNRAPTPWTMWLSLSTAVIAVLAAIASLEAGANANDAIVRKDDAILHQSKADDAWAHYQAAGIKAVVYATQADGTSRPDLAARWQGEAERERSGQRALKEEAEGGPQAPRASPVCQERHRVPGVDRARRHRGAHPPQGHVVGQPRGRRRRRGALRARHLARLVPFTENPARDFSAGRR